MKWTGGTSQTTYRIATPSIFSSDTNIMFLYEMSNQKHLIVRNIETLKIKI